MSLRNKRKEKTKNGHRQPQMWSNHLCGSQKKRLAKRWPGAEASCAVGWMEAVAVKSGSYEIKGQKVLCRHWETRVRLEVLVSQSCLTLCNPMDCSLPGSSVHGFLQARILEWVAIPFSRGSSQPRIWTWSPALQADSLPSEPSGKPQGLKSGPSVRAHWSWRKPGCVRGKGDCQRADWDLDGNCGLRKARTSAQPRCRNWAQLPAGSMPAAAMSPWGCNTHLLLHCGPGGPRRNGVRERNKITKVRTDSEGTRSSQTADQETQVIDSTVRIRNYPQWN